MWSSAVLAAVGESQEREGSRGGGVFKMNLRKKRIRACPIL